jgi:CubicO group peptidase (beta-lactamase class C family)
VTDFFPEFRDFAQGATIRNLLQHTAGFPDYSELCGRGPARNEHIVELMVKKGKLDFPPGTRHLYSNTGYDLLAVLVERSSGMSFPGFVEQKIFTALGMKDTFVNRWGIPPKPNLASMAEAYQPVKTVDGRTFPYGFGWQLIPESGMTQYAHSGAWAGYRTFNARFPEKRFAVVVLTNSPRANLQAVVRKAIDLYLR